MKVVSSRIFSITLVLLISSLFFLNLNGAANELGTFSIKLTNDTLTSDRIIILGLNNGDTGSDDEMKHLTASVENIIIFPLVSGKIFPNTPVDFVVETIGPTPEKVTLFLDRNEPSLNVTFDLANGNVISSEDLDGLVGVDRESSSTIFNSTSKRWEITFNLNFDWSFPKDFPKDIEALLIDVYGGSDHLIIEDAYIFEPDLVLSGEPIFKVKDPSFVTEDGFIKGGVDILIQQISVHFEGAPPMSPLPEDITLGVEDVKGRFWEYTPVNRVQLNSVSFSLPIPKDDGLNTFTFSVISSPPGSDVEGEAEFDFIVDSTVPTIADFRYGVSGNDLKMNWALKELGSGLDDRSVQYSIYRDGEQIRPWTPVGIVNIIEGRLMIEVSDLEIDNLDVRLRMSDRVGNDNPSDQSFKVSMDPASAHDVSIDSVDFNPDIVIINQNIGFRAMVNNHGTEDEENLQVEVQRNGEVYTYIDVSELPAGSSREIRWNWKAVDGMSEFKIILDPQGRVSDVDVDDNVVQLIIVPEYLDVKAREDYLLVSDPQAENLDLVTLSFAIKSIGSIESGPIKVTFMQDSKFMGLFQIPSIYKEGSRELIVDWKVDTSVRNLTLMIDPYNEVLESIEDNNIVNFQNPFYKAAEEPISVYPEDKIESEDPIDIITPPQPTDMNTGTGGTIFTGPEIIREEEYEDESAPVLPVIVTPVPEKPAVIPPFILPTAGFIIGTTFLGFALFGLRSEIIRFKLLGLLIPLYSKLKKNKIVKGVRHEILGYLKAKPGVNYSELKRNLDLNDGSLVHHLRVLEREEKIYSKKMGKYKLFYVSTYSRQASIRDYISPFQMRIMEIIFQNPGIVPNKLSKILDRSQTDMSYHLGELARNGLLEKRKKGRNIHYYIRDEFSEVVA